MVGEAHDAGCEAATSRLSLCWRPRNAPECELVGSADLRRSAALGVRDAGRVASERLRWRPHTGMGAPGRPMAREHGVVDVTASCWTVMLVADSTGGSRLDDGR